MRINDIYSKTVYYLSTQLQAWILYNTLYPMILHELLLHHECSVSGTPRILWEIPIRFPALCEHCVISQCRSCTQQEKHSITGPARTGSQDYVAMARKVV